MADVHSKKVRSYNMSQIKSKNTKPELLVRKFLFTKGLRYRLYDKKLPGKPDLVFPKYKKILFIHGCFWHGHKDCKYFVIPKTRAEWWIEKIEKNIINDNKSINQLTEMGWEIITLWECELKGSRLQNTLNKVYKEIVK